MTEDVGGVHGGAGKLATTTDVEKDVAGSASALQRVTASSGGAHPDTPNAQPAVEQQVFALSYLVELVAL